jgi:hypothetical protein
MNAANDAILVGLLLAWIAALANFIWRWIQYRRVHQEVRDYCAGKRSKP